MEPITLLGLIAGLFSTFAVLPQVIKTLKMKGAKDLSTSWILFAIIGTSLWLTYGLYLNDLPLIASNIIAILLFSSLLVMKWRFG